MCQATSVPKHRGSHHTDIRLDRWLEGDGYLRCNLLLGFQRQGANNGRISLDIVVGRNRPTLSVPVSLCHANVAISCFLSLTTACSSGVPLTCVWQLCNESPASISGYLRHRHNPRAGIDKIEQHTFALAQSTFRQRRADRLYHLSIIESEQVSLAFEAVQVSGVIIDAH